MANGRNYSDIVPKTRDYVEEGTKEKKNYNDIVPKTRNYVEERTKKKNYGDIVPRTRSYIPKPPVDNPFYKPPIYDPSKPGEIVPIPPNPISPELAERFEQDSYNEDQEILTDILDQPDTRTSPDDPKEHQQRVEERADADIRRQRQSVYAAIAEDFTVDELNSDMGYGFFDFIRTALEYGYSPEEVIAEIRKPEVYEALGIQPLGYSRSKGPDPFQQIRRERERIAREAME